MSDQSEAKTVTSTSATEGPGGPQRPIDFIGDPQQYTHGLGKQDHVSEPTVDSKSTDPLGRENTISSTQEGEDAPGGPLKNANPAEKSPLVQASLILDESKSLYEQALEKYDDGDFPAAAALSWSSYEIDRRNGQARELYLKSRKSNINLRVSN